MSSSTAVLESSPPKDSGAECRVWERHACGLDTACQPIAARGDNDMSWSGQIHDVSVAGIGLLIKRRFERGTGLAIEVPETAASPADTLLAKVVHTTHWPDGRWLLGCVFVSQLGEDELQRLVDMGQQQELAPVNDEPPPCSAPPLAAENLIGDVTWQYLTAAGMVQRTVRRFHARTKWPLSSGTILRVWFGKKPQDRARVRVERCYQSDGRWFVDYTFVDSPKTALLRSFGHAV